MELFDIDGGNVVLSPTSLYIPPFKKLWERDASEDKERATKEIAYVAFLCNLSTKNPYNAYTDSIREEKVNKDTINKKPDTLIKEAIKKYKINGKEKSVTVTLGDVTKCRAIKPRFTASKDGVEKYRRRYLPARKVGTLVVSTNKGLLVHEDVQEQNLGGVLIAYFY